MSKLKESIGLGLLFAAGTAGIYGYAEVSQGRERDDIVACYEIDEADLVQSCLERVDEPEDGYILGGLALAGAVGVVACGAQAYRSVRDSGK